MTLGTIQNIRTRCGKSVDQEQRARH